VRRFPRRARGADKQLANGHAKHLPSAPQRAAWLADKGAAEQAEAAMWADRVRMPPLAGSPKATVWAEHCRHQLVSAAYTALVTDASALTEEEWERLEDAARTITRAGWWLGQRDADPADLPELLAAATSTDRTTETVARDRLPRRSRP
jgi:hypothetical protein